MGMWRYDLCGRYARDLTGSSLGRGPAAADRVFTDGNPITVFVKTHPGGSGSLDQEESIT